MPSLNTENAILSNAIKVNSSYNVGIGGAASGSYKLQVTGASNFTGAYTGFQFNSAGAYPAYNTYFGAIGTNFSNSNSELDIWNTVGGGFVFRRQTGASAQTALMTIANSGNIAINGVPTEIGGFTSLIINNTSNGSFLDLNNSGINNLRLLSLSLVDQRIQAQGNLTFYTAAIARMAITSDGNVGIGTSSPFVIGGTNLTLNNATDVAFTLGVNGTRTGQLYASNSEVRLGSVTSVPLRFYTNDAEKMRITSGGNVLIGNSTDNGAKLQVGQYSALSQVTTPTFVTLDNSYAVGSTQAGDKLKLYLLRGDVNMGFGVGAIGDLNAWSDGIFRIYTGGFERMRIGSSGGVESKNMGTTVGGFVANSPNGYASGGYVHSSLTSASNGWYHFIGQSGNGSTITTNNILIYGSGDVANTNNSYGVISDIKLKENIVDTSPKLDDLMKVRIVNYNLKADLGYESNKQIGVIAQELEKVFPGLVDENEDIDTEGKGLGTKTKSVKMSVFVPMLIKAIQEQQVQIEAQQQQINSLINR